MSSALATGRDTGGGAGLLDAHPEASTDPAARTVTVARATCARMRSPRPGGRQAPRAAPFVSGPAVPNRAAPGSVHRMAYVFHSIGPGSTAVFAASGPPRR